jgi:hypothetical protein
MLKALQCEEGRARQLELAEHRAAVSAEPTQAESSAIDSSVSSLSHVESSLAGIAAEAQKLEGQLSRLAGDSDDPVRRRAMELLATCRQPS